MIITVDLYHSFFLSDDNLAAVTSGWISDPAAGMITPKKTELPQKEIPLTSEQELALLTDYVSFIEN